MSALEQKLIDALTGADDSTVRIWDSPNGRLIQKIEAHPKPFNRP